MLKLENLNEEQKTAVKKSIRKFFIASTVAGALYGLFLAFASFVIILIDHFYIHSKQFLFLGSFGTTLITFRGLLNTVEERRELLSKEVASIVPKSE